LTAARCGTASSCALDEAAAPPAVALLRWLEPEGRFALAWLETQS
jgi:hypothetical protein